MINVPFALAFGAGMLATVNPCGFALLPAYLSYFLGIDSRDTTTRAGISRSLAVGSSVAAGFLAVFALCGLAISHLSARVEQWAPWLTIPIGVGFVVLGVAMLRGFEVTISLPKVNRSTPGRTGRSMFLFGVSYAVASISCTLGPFMSAVAGTFRRENLLSAMLAFVSYAAGMTLVLLALTVSMGLAQRSLLMGLRRAMPFITRASGLLLILAGSYVAYYGWYALRVRDGDFTRSGLVNLVTSWSDTVGQWVYEVGPVRLGVLLAVSLGAVLTLTYGVRVRRR